MLAERVEEDQLTQLQYPIFASPKLDGIRCLIHPELGPVTRTLKPIPNHYIRETLNRECVTGLDGELIVGNPYDPETYNRTTSQVMSREGEPEFMFYVFDQFTNPERPYGERLNAVYEQVENACENLREFLAVVSSVETYNEQDIIHYLNEECSLGGEGVILRGHDSPYKYGRSTRKQQYLLKIKNMEDAEAEIVGFMQLYKNENPAVQNELGYTERGHAQAGRVLLPMLGALVVRNDEFGEFELGTGFTRDMRIAIWEDQENYRGQLVKFKFKRVGMKDKPLIASFKGFRDRRDL